MSYDPTRPCAGGCGKTVRPKHCSKDRFPGTVGIIRDGKCWQCTNPVDPSRQKNMVGPKIFPCEGVCGRMLRPANTPKNEHPDTVPVTKNRMCWSCNNKDSKTERMYVYPGPDHVYETGTSKCLGICGRLVRSTHYRADQRPGTVPRVKEGMCRSCSTNAGKEPGTPALEAATGLGALIAAREKREAERRAREWRLENLIVTPHGIRKKAS